MMRMHGSEHRDVAVVGIGCRFPPAVNCATAFSRMLCVEHDVVGDIPADCIDTAAYFDPRSATPGKMMGTPWGVHCSESTNSTPDFYISPPEAASMDPQQRIPLETAWKVLEDAGVNVASRSGVRTGVFREQWTRDFEARLFTDPRVVDFLRRPGDPRLAAYVVPEKGATLNREDCAEPA